MKFETFPVGMLETNCYIGWAPETGAAFIVDPGTTPDRLIEFTVAHGLKPEAILLTHGHFDHIMGIETWKHLYPEIELYAGKEEAELLADPDKNMTCRFRKHQQVLHPEHLLADEECFTVCGIPMQFLHTPGHTKGSGCYYIKAADAFELDEKAPYAVGVTPILFSGDTLFRGSCGRTDFEGGSMEEMEASMKRLAMLPDETIVLPGHGYKSTIAWEMKHNPYMVY